MSPPCAPSDSVVGHRLSPLFGPRPHCRHDQQQSRLIQSLKRTNTPLGHVLGLVNAYVLVVEPDTNMPDVIINSTIDPAVNDAGS